MPPIIATLVFALGILGLFLLDRDPKARTSKALWLPVTWLWISGSREVSQWLGVGPRQAYISMLEGNAFDRNILAVLLAMGFIVLLSRGKQLGALLRANAAILLFFAYCAVSIFWSDYPDVAFKRWIKALGDLVMVMIVLTDPNRSAAIKRLLARAAFVLLPVSVLLIKYYPSFGRHYSTEFTPVNTGVTRDKNMLGMVCLILGLGSLWRFLQAYRDTEDTRTRQMIAYGIILAMAAWLFWIANSMTSLACFLLAGGLMAVTSMPALARKTSVVHLYMATMISVSVFALFLDSGGRLVQAVGRDATLTGRTELWDQIIPLVGNPFLGAGFESFWLGERLIKLWTMYWWLPNEAHNGYLEVYLNLGLIGLFLMAVIIVTGYRKVIAAFRDSEIGQLRLAYFATAIIYSLTEAGFRVRSPVWIFFLWAIIAIPKPSVSEDLDISATMSSHDPVDLSLVSTRVYEQVR